VNVDESSNTGAYQGAKEQMEQMVPTDNEAIGDSQVSSQSCHWLEEFLTQEYQALL
jgi:hypothetical protein